MLVSETKPSQSVTVRGFSLLAAEDSSDLENRADHLAKLTITEPTGVFQAVFSALQGYGLGRAETRARNMVAVEGMRRYGANAAIVRSTGVGYNEFNEPVAVTIEADLYRQ